MSTFEWSDHYNVNIPAIDNEHKLLVSLINDIDNVQDCQNSLQSQIIKETLHRLSKYIRSHFESEERFLLFNNYPEFTEHKDKHTELLAHLERFEQRFKAENIVFSDKMLLFLKDWLVRHIILHDCKFGHYFSETGISNEYC
ncbi:MAG: hemerythrin family protein [Geobacteraceae bacterium]|nr:hemerythrin family protein [Geobacteraceae bacterium]